MPRIWGGHQLKPWFDVEGPDPIGEYWVLSGHPNGPSIAVNGPLAGLSLVELTERYPDEFLGRSPQPRFPLLVKFLEASADLSVQVHPDDAQAQQIEGDFGKTEAWYILQTTADGKVNYGHRFANRTALLEAVAAGRVRAYLDYLPIQRGQLVYVPARTLHALLAGTMVIEVQQTSDITYRVYDWDRLDDQGRSRPLHVAAAADVLTYAMDDSAYQEPAIVPPQTVHHSDGVLHERLRTCAYFTIERIEFTGEPTANYTMNLGRTGNPDIVIVIEGHCDLAWSGGTLTLNPGSTVLIPASLTAYRLQASSGSSVLRVYY